jgi:cytochrome P450
MTSAARRWQDLPGPRGVPVFGNLLQLQSSRLHLQLEQWCRDYGPAFRLRIGPRRVLVIGDHTQIAAALRDRPDGFRRTERLEQVSREMGLQGGVFISNGSAWKQQRRMVMAGFDPAHVKRYHPALQRVAQRLAGRWAKAASAGSTIDLQADLMRFTVDAIAGLAFGAEVNTLESDGDVIQQHLNRVFPMLFKRMFAPLPTWRWWPSADDRALAHSIGAIAQAVAGFIAQARARLQADPARRAQPQNLLEAMLVAAEAPDSGMNDQHLLGNVLTLLLAGEDTTANTLAWLLHLLWQHPAALTRACAEVRGACQAGSSPTLEQLARLDWVEACIHETMRLKPVAPQNTMQALRDTTLAGVQVQAGTLVMAVMRHDATSEQHLPQARAFQPERWLADGGPAAAGSAVKRLSMPFGAGPRICPGRYLAMLEMKMAVATLLSNFDIAHVGTANGREPEERLQLAMSPVGLQMRLRLRQVAAEPA